jgi:hypothetical protein
MGTLKGLIRFTGSFDGLSFYEGRQGTVIVRATGGFKGEAIRTKPNYQRTRENALEFKHVVAVGKLVRLALRSYLHPMRIPYGHNRVVQLFHRIQQYDTLNVRGARTVAQGLQSKEGKALLDGFELDPRHALDTHFPVDYYFRPEVGSMVLNAFNSCTLHFPEGSDKARLKFRLLKIDFEQLEFQLSEEQEIVFFRNESIPATTFTNVIPLGTGVLIGVLSISYFQEISGQFISIKERSLRIFI